ncbi:hypothetical protein DNHGIG_40640 [Collibacillus ludicampi]|uniref:SLH domain-containing protein n=1 Tax=Collibacillus ludicampi TaxID=2771369 RepID=A0AAV4LKU3_9BACL|nr:S-layer homology domain-containing protein [Collibacillus ludicampi]GIM48515.1 hypothetical protein DNHGIG_40640 [Collibacillus ludicampi]
MKKTMATLSMISALSLSAVPAFAKGGNGNIQIIGNGHARQNIHITNTTNVVDNTVVFGDVKGHWAKKYIMDLVKKGILSGKSKQKFDPDAQVTRAEFATMVTRYFQLKNDSTQQDFEDVPPTSWEYKYVEAAKDYFDAYRTLDGGLLFKPFEGDKREDVAVTLIKILLKQNPDMQLLDADTATQLLQEKFPKDYTKIPQALQPYVATAVKYDLMHGYGDGSFRPDRVVTRAEAATLLDRLQDSTVVVMGDQSNTGATTTTTTSSGTETTVSQQSAGTSAASGSTTSNTTASNQNSVGSSTSGSQSTQTTTSSNTNGSSSTETVASNVYGTTTNNQ